MFFHYLADQILQWASSNNVQIIVGEQNYTLPNNVTSFVDMLPSTYQKTTASIFGMFDILFVLVIVMALILFVIRFITNDSFDYFQARTEKKRKLKTKSIPIHKRIMLKFGLAEVREVGKK